MLVLTTDAGVRVERSGSVQVLEKAGKVLDCFSADNPAMRVADLRERTGLPATTCLRIVRTLVEQDLLQREGDVYRIGLRVLVWGAAATAGSVLLAAAGPLIRRLRDDTGETSVLFVRQDAQRVIVDVAQSRQSIIFRGTVGEAMPLAAGAAGKVFMAWDPAALQRARPLGIPQFTHGTVTDWDAVDEQLARGRERGFMFADQERETGLSSIAAPVFGPGGRLVAALSLGAPAFRLPRDVAERLGPDVASGATALSRAIGWIDGPTPTPTPGGHHPPSRGTGRSR
ncbi:IclR family transcriptional regulator [Pseudonocardia sp. MH-G8]|nr:IclR family transcriptional regulator [Pseudonocardia sp. MH-G8]